MESVNANFNSGNITTNSELGCSCEMAAGTLQSMTPTPALSLLDVQSSKVAASSGQITQFEAIANKLMGAIEKLLSTLTAMLNKLNTQSTPPQTQVPPNTPPVQDKPVVNVPVTKPALDIGSYMSKAFQGKKTVNEEDAYLAVIGWGFNVMADYAGDAKVSKYFESKKLELIDKATKAGKTPQLETIGNDILKAAVKDGIITQLQAEHTKGNAFKASQFDKNLESLSYAKSVATDVSKAVSLINTALSNFISGVWENEFRKL